MGFFQTFFFSKVLKVVLQMMLSQKIAALFALMMFASQGVIGRPASSDNEGSIGAGRTGLLGGGGGGLSGLLGGGGSSSSNRIGSGGSVSIGAGSNIGVGVRLSGHGGAGGGGGGGIGIRDGAGGSSLEGGHTDLLGGAWYVKHGFASDPSLLFYAI